jgi:hypothetical protein
MTVHSILPQTTVKSNRAAPQVEHELAFTYGEWNAMSNGMLCAMMGHTGRELDDARRQWPKALRKAWDLGFNKTTTMLGRADVSYALYQRFSGEEV